MQTLECEDTVVVIKNRAVVLLRKILPERVDQHRGSLADTVFVAGKGKVEAAPG